VCKAGTASIISDNATIEVGDGNVTAVLSSCASLGVNAVQTGGLCAIECECVHTSQHGVPLRCALIANTSALRCLLLPAQVTHRLTTHGCPFPQAAGLLATAPL
jgi:hypothetical protein